MKNILYGLLATLLFSNFATAQLMSDSIHNKMMNNYVKNLNNILTPYSVQQGVTVDQLKKKIVNGNFTLPNDAQTSIMNAADSLKTYGSQFATVKGLTATSDELKYFYSTFSPSTAIQNGKLTESTTTMGLTPTDMWTCALSNFATDSCGSSILVGDASDLNGLAAASVNRLVVAPAEKYGMLVMLGGFTDCLYNSYLKNMGLEISKQQFFIDDITLLNEVAQNIITITTPRLNELRNIGWENLIAPQQQELSTGLGFQNINSYITFCNNIGNTYLRMKTIFFQPNGITRGDYITVINHAIYFSSNPVTINSAGCPVGQSPSVVAWCNNNKQMAYLNCKYQFWDGVLNSVATVAGLEQGLDWIAGATNLALTVYSYADCTDEADFQHCRCIK